MTKIRNERLADERKRLWLTETKLAAYREIVVSSGIYHDMDGVVDGEKRRSMASKPLPPPAPPPSPTLVANTCPHHFCLAPKLCFDVGLFGVPACPNSFVFQSGSKEKKRAHNGMYIFTPKK